MFEGLTNKGKEYMAKCLAENKPVSFAKVKIGNGTINPGENPETFIDIKSIKKEVSIVDKTQIGDTAKLTVQLDNTGVLEGYFPREIGIYVQDGGQELLYWYINDGSESSWLPPASKSPVKFKYHINLMVTNLETVIVNWSGKELWVDREYLGKELDKKLTNGNLPSIITNAETIFKALQANTGIKFDENLLYLNDSGTKKKGYCYIDKLTDGIFECIQETTTTVNNATYFKNFSNKENSDRLSNLIKVISIKTSIETLGQQFNKPVKTNYKYPYGYSLIGISKNLSEDLVDLNIAIPYSSDLFEVNIGISPDSFIQYAITESSNKENGHIIHLIFIKENYL
ncbi:hypothetical protein [uncultured Fusobacterium sp.]|uniref:hypothetical protein n=1 Tax=uncultured Fusobacterium sp. TaxID=159267 RepID=UPI0025E86CF1|nr:hypothetical protein [uncultured Fusobacterium sp.]